MKIDKFWLGRTFRNAEPGQEGSAGGEGGNENSNPDNANGDSGGGSAPLSEGESWTAGLAPEYSSHLEKNGIKDIDGLIKQHIDLQSHLGNSIRVPSAEAGDDDKRAFYEKIQKHAPDLMPKPVDDDSKAAIFSTLGKPSEAKEYEVEVPEQLAASFGEERLNNFREIALKNNLTRDQFKGVMSEILAADAQSYQQAVEQQQQGHASLKGKWGDAYEQRMGELTHMMEQTGAPEGLTEAVKSGNIDAAALEWIYALRGRMDQEEGSNLSRDQGQGRLTPDEAENQMQEILNNKEHPYWNPGHPDHKRAIDKMTKLGRAARPQTANRKIGSQSFEMPS